MAEIMGYGCRGGTTRVPRVIVTESAALGLERCRKFLAARNPRASQRAARAIDRSFAQLQTNPESGRLVSDLVELRELVIEFGTSGYIALYHYDPELDTVFVLAFRHQKEAGY